MSTRPGCLDPGILLFLLRKNANVDELERILNKESGLAGLSGLAGGTRVILPEAKAGNARAKLAMDVFVHRLQAGMGQMLAGLRGPPDAFVFTDAIGEDEPVVRSRACEAFNFLGVEIDPDKNEESPMDTDISQAKSKIKILIIKGREDWEIARQCHRYLMVKSPH
jgi:acetate kinase